MSADNWAECPGCLADRSAVIEEMQRALDESYGQVPLEEFDEKRAALTAKRNEPFEPTWREDYEMGLDGDEFYVYYKGGCSTCSRKHTFEHHDTVRTDS